MSLDQKKGIEFGGKILRIFIKTGGNGERIRVFNNLPSSEQEKLKKLLDSQILEEPLIGGLLDENIGFLITDKSFIQTDGKIKKKIAFETIKDCKADLTQIKLVDEAKTQKLEIELFSDKSLTFEIESGPPFIGIWNIVLFIASHNRYHRNN